MDKSCLLTLWILKYDSLIKKNIKNEAVNFNNIRLFPSYNIYNFYFGVSSVIGFKCMVWLDIMGDVDFIIDFKYIMFFYKYLFYNKET